MLVSIIERGYLPLAPCADIGDHSMAIRYVWKATNTTRVTRHDDIWFVSSQEGWAVNSDGKILYTNDAGDHWEVVGSDSETYFRCISMTPEGRGWIGAIVPRTKRLWRSTDGQNWSVLEDRLLPIQPTAICGICTVGEDVIYGSGTQYPNRPAAIIKSTNGGEDWISIDMNGHADLLIDIYFTDPENGWVVGGKGGDEYEQLKPVVLRTNDGGNTWTNKLKGSGIQFPLGEWGWKIQFLDDNLGFISTENFNAAAILKTRDGGESWERIVVQDQQGNMNLEGIGFLDEYRGWVGGWGGPFPRPPGFSSGTEDGGETWFDANDVGMFINRFRFTGEKPIVAYASGEHVYRCVEVTDDAMLSLLPAASKSDDERVIPHVSETLDVKVEVPVGARHLRIACHDRRLRLIHVLCDERDPMPGSRELSWNFASPSGEDFGLGYFFYRVSIDDEATSSLVARVSKVAPAELGRRVAKMIAEYAPYVTRSHGDLTLPDSTGQPVAMRSLFDQPIELMAGLIRGGWVIPFLPDRSMFLTEIIGTDSKRGPMYGRMHEDDVSLLLDWIAAGAVLPTETPTP